MKIPFVIIKILSFPDLSSSLNFSEYLHIHCFFGPLECTYAVTVEGGDSDRLICLGHTILIAQFGPTYCALIIPSTFTH